MRSCPILSKPPLHLPLPSLWTESSTKFLNRASLGPAHSPLSWDSLGWELVPFLHDLKRAMSPTPGKVVPSSDSASKLGMDWFLWLVLTWCVDDSFSLSTFPVHGQLPNAPFHYKISDELNSPLSESSYATKFHHQDSYNLLPLPLTGVVKLMIRTFTKFCSPLLMIPSDS